MRGGVLAWCVVAVCVSTGGEAEGAQVPVASARLDRDAEIAGKVRKLAEVVLTSANTLLGCKRLNAVTYDTGIQILPPVARVPFGSVAINTDLSGSHDARVLEIQLVTDASEVDPKTGGRVPDETSITGLCEAFPPNGVRCSANALRAMFTADPEGRPAFLTLAHELRHLLQDSEGGAYAPMGSVDCSRARDEKIQSILGLACFPEGKAAQLRREDDADDFAIRVWAVTPVMGGPFAIEAFGSPSTLRSTGALGRCPEALMGPITQAIPAEGEWNLLDDGLPNLPDVRASLFHGSAAALSRLDDPFSRSCAGEEEGLTLAKNLVNALEQWHTSLGAVGEKVRNAEEVLQSLVCKTSGKASFPIAMSDHPSPAARIKALMHGIGVIALQERSARVERQVVDYYSVAHGSWGGLLEQPALRLPESTNDFFHIFGSHLLPWNSSIGGGFAPAGGVAISLDLDSPASPLLAPTQITQNVKASSVENVAYCETNSGVLLATLALHVAMRAIVDEDEANQRYAEGVCRALVTASNDRAYPRCRRR
jgi:hypothetical protein